MSMPPACPGCRSPDIRPLNAEAVGLEGYRCNECSRTFYVSSLDTPPDPANVTDLSARGPGRNLQTG